MANKFRTRLAALIMAGGLTIGSIFGLSGCKNKNIEQPETEKEALEEVVEEQQAEIDALQQQIKELQEQGKDVLVLQKELEQNLIKRDLLMLLTNSYRNNNIVKVSVSSEDQFASIYSSRNKSIGIGKDKQDDLYFIYDGEEIKSIKIGKSGECSNFEVDDPTYIKLFNTIKYDIIEDSEFSTFSVETKDDECVITCTKYTNEQKEEKVSVEKYYFDLTNQNNITKIEVEAPEINCVYTFDVCTEEEFNQNYAEVETKIKEFSAQANPDHGV